MYLIEREHRRFEQVQRFIKLKFSMRLGIVRKVLALEVLHDDVRRPVLLEIVAQGDNVSLSDEL